MYFIKTVVEFIEVAGASCLGKRGLNIFLQDDIDYINVEVSSCPYNRVIKYFIKDIVEYIDVVGVSCLGNRGIKYFYTKDVEYINIEGASCPCNRRMYILLKML
jgi:hypothetical protein